MAAGDAPRGFALPESLGSGEAYALAAGLRALRGAALEIDAAGVRSLGGLCLEVLLSAAATWRADRLPLTVSEPSAAMAETLRVAGLSHDALTSRGAG
jgi:chemotaxis protein CheX